ncbi:2-dehydropantoate 2-reductase [Streptacidiphilus sp. N1-3]|uniref:2-dehydropantoate 2-reductase n=1 Tax=Streptacidiphilus alkalitolerans TaxID=3342712 RepID=A0ABV6X2Q0_9ACTN
MAETARPTVAVFGAGSIGCHLGGALADVADVTLIGRAPAMDVLREHGLTISAAGRAPRRIGPDRLRLATGPDAAADADFVLITVKTAATAEAGRQLAPHLRSDAVVVSFQNGLHNPDTLRAELPGRTVLAGMVPYNVVQTGPGTVHQGMPGTLMVEQAAAVEELTRLCTAAGLPVEARADIREVQYGKLLMNLNNAVNALSGLPLREQLGLRAYRLCLALCQREALAAYRAAGVRPTRLGPVPAALTPYVLRLPDALFRRLAASTLDIDAHARSSMWEDLERGRPTEIDSLQGEIVALAARHGLPAPANACLTDLVHQAETAPDTLPWTGERLLQQLRSATRA